jgi:hypothetical protein
MKLRCVNDQETVQEKTGWFSSKPVDRKVDGITVGKAYQALVGPICNNSEFEGPQQSRTRINPDDYNFLIFDDNREWSFYDLEHFEPVIE